MAKERFETPFQIMGYSDGTTFTFETNARSYWIRASALILGLIAFALLPLVLPSEGDSSGFTLMLVVIAILATGSLTYARPQKLILQVTPRK